MNNSNKNFLLRESLLLISSMIETTKHSISYSSRFFLLYGEATIVADTTCCFCNYRKLY